MKTKHIVLSLLTFFNILIFQTSFGQQTQNNKGKAEASLAKIEQTGRWVNSFSNQKLVELPIGIKKTVSNVQYSVGVTKATFSPEYTTLTVFCRVDLPQTKADGTPVQLFFGADNVKLSHQGGIIGDAKLVLLGNVDIPFNNNQWQLSLYGGFEMSTGAVNDLTYVTIDCDGFKEMKISGAVEFSRDLILPLENGVVNEAKTTVPKTYYNGVTKQVPNRVKGEFSIMGSNFNDILVNVSLQPFVLKQKRNGSNYDGNFQFLVSNAVLDLSDLQNHPAVQFPDYYQQNGLLMPSVNAWRGVYVETFDIGLPKEFKTTDTQQSSERIHLGASKLIIDKFGVSGTFYGDNIFPLEKGITSEQKSWAYSLDHIDVTIAANHFVKASLNGQILLPITKKSNTTAGSNSTAVDRKALTYNGFISMNEQHLTVVTKDSLSFDLWKAKAVLLPNSSVELKIINGAFFPKANLHGNISIGSNMSANDDSDVSGKKTVDFKGITFQNLQLQTVSPMISVQTMGYTGNVSFSNFPVSIGNISVTMQATSARLDFDLGLNLMESIGVGATARIGIKGKLHEEEFKQKWKYDGLDLSAISINAEFSGLKMNGQLILMNNDPVYGDGFSADLDVNVVGVVTVHSKAIFGRTTFRYWCFDASVKWPAVPSPFMINGFGGGASYKMRRKEGISRTEFSPSGLSYVPDENLGLGLKALIYFHIGKEEVFDGEAGFEIAFNANGGINTLAIFGKGGIMAKIPGLKNVSDLMNKVAASPAAMSSFMGVTDNSLSGSFASKFLPKAKAVIPGDVEGKVGINVESAIEFDFQNNSMHGTFDVYINTPGNFISGIGAGGRAGWAVFHKDPQDWYIYIGTPDDRCGVKMGVAGVSLTTTSYFMAGTELPGSPPPPDIVAQILGVDAQSLNYMRDENSLANGGGFAFGASLDFDTGDLSFLLFYARFQAGIGFDIMLKDYGEARCSNTGDQVGINGWYANGQSYAYLQGELGIRVKLLFINLKIPIISGGAAVLLQAKLPNPFWMRGYVGGHMSILGGLIKGRFRFKLTIGEECIFENAGPLGGIKLISDVTPKRGTEKADVFTIPQATFAMKVNEALVIPEDDGDNTYKIVLEKFKILDGTTEIPGTLEWTSMKDRVSFISTDILPPNKSLKVQVEVSFQKLINGVFTTITQNGQVAKEFEEREFTTGGAPNYIPLTNILYSYPVVEQKYFFEEEYNNGYIKLKRGQDYLFEDPTWETNVKMNALPTGNSLKTAFSYDNNSNEVSYTLPNIEQDKNYNFSIVSSLKALAQPTGNNTTSTTNINNEGNDITVTQNQAIEQSKEGEIERLSYSFGTSKYKTFTAKMDSSTTPNYNFGLIYSDVIYLTNTISSQESYDLTDLQGNIYCESTPLLTATSKLNDMYYGTDMAPYLYNQYPIGGSYTITHRDTDELGLPPAKALPLSTYYLTSLESNINPSWLKSNFPFKYNLPLLYKQDWVDLRDQVVNDYVSGTITSNSLAYQFLNKEFTFMRYGFYEVDLKYRLPGNKKTTTYIYKFKNNNQIR
ncbi:hypothetical protein [Flavobacterium psychrophilum]|uniref:hypothetical protein n=2 Tax=Flavobacterium psychrophilum TaxID=96345 RepID=UPI000B7C33CF|nr:hypothetical protein [Flavobacterium psychrophilum]MCB6089477.1 hypothetical protein [Flavobacterium psychrophilum]MCB6232054.1 hypothetical protein [Flavobacterium psychrophilum]MEB3380554.1 hypothetical protein [Flavobacterium psychrophilum]SNA84832.1 conserved exported hypothetical protein [Flavobacterium psychrophilum]SNA87991.1 conserved exported hypothetical protein [Flavobacterium psychrophilum]